MIKVLLTGAMAILLLTGCSTRTSPMVTFDVSSVDFAKEHKVGEDCRFKFPIVAQLTNMIFGVQALDVRTVAMDNDIKKVQYFEFDEGMFERCIVVHGE